MALTKVTGQVINNTTDLVVGVTTVGGGLSATDGFFSGIVTFSNSVSVAGTLTYEDVTNIDSVGLITARNGVVVGSGITLSKDGDIFATGVTTSTSFTGTLNTAAQPNVTSLGTLTGLTVSGDVNISDKIFHTGDSDTAIRFPANDIITTETGGTERLKVEQAGNVNIPQNLKVAGVVTATSFSGSGANLTNIDSGMFIKTSAGIHTVGDQSNVGIGTTNPASGLDVSLKTDGIALPEGTTSQRPSGSQKFIRFNSTTGSLELYNGNQWVEILSDYSQTGSTALG